MDRKRIENELIEAERYLQENSLIQRVEHFWDTEEVSKKIHEIYESTKVFAYQCIELTPEVLRDKGEVYVQFMQEQDLKKDALMIFKCNVTAAMSAQCLALGKAEVIGNQQFEDEIIQKEVSETLKEASEMVLMEVMNAMYSIPEEIIRQISNFVVSL